MTSVRNGEADRFVAAPPAGMFVFLVFGTDPGLISERVKRLVIQSVDDPKDPFQLVRLDADDVANDPGRLIDEVRTVPLFGGRRAILFEAGLKSIVSALEGVLALPFRDCAVIVEAGNLKRDAPLRKLVEAARAAAAIECHPDDNRDLGRLINEEARAAGLEIANEVRDGLIDLLGIDRLTTRGELSKLMLYAHGTGRITMDDVEAIVANASATIADVAVDGAFLGDFPSIEVTLARVFAESGDPGALLGAALRHGYLLHRARIAIESGQTIGSALESATRWGLNYKRRAAFERQARGWTAAKLAKALDTLAVSIARCRLDARVGQLIAARALWSVALAAPRGSD